MKKEEVPQHGGLTAGCREVNYAIDADGNYSLELSVGWEAKNTTLRQAWAAIVEQLQQVLEEINAGHKSPLAYHMVKNQMDVALLAQYSGFSRWRVKRHLKPQVFNRLSSRVLAVYAALFRISSDQLQQVPERPDLHIEDMDTSEAPL
jgi:DNA-binding phage protein